MSNQWFDHTAINSAIIARLEAFCRDFFPQGKKAGNEWKVGSFAGGPGNSLGISLTNGKAHDRATGEGASNPIGILRFAFNLSFVEACRMAAEWLGNPGAYQHGSKAFQAHQSDCEAKYRQAELEAKERAAKRAMLPRLIESPIRGVRNVARLRNLPVEGVSLAHDLGYLRFAYWRNRPAWVICNHARTLAQARRMDGKELVADGKLVKAQTLPGSVGGLIGEELLSSPGRVLLTEGGPDFLAACYICKLSRDKFPDKPERQFLPLTFLGAGHRFNERQIDKLTGRNVTIIAHFDDNEAGMRAARRWHDQLTGYARSVSIEAIQSYRAIMPSGDTACDLADLFQCNLEINDLIHNLLTFYQK